MTAGDSLSMALANLARRKGRTLLTVIGVLIGVAALVLMVSLGVGLERSVQSLFGSESGLRTILVTKPMNVSGKNKKLFVNTGMPGMKPSVPVTDKEIDEIRRVEGVETVIPELQLVLDVDVQGVTDGHAGNTLVGSVMPEETREFRTLLKEGALWTSDTDKSCIISSLFLGVRNFNKGEVIGKNIIFRRNFSDESEQPPVDDVTFKIVGIFDSKKLGMRAAVLMPFASALKLRDVTKGGYMGGSKPGTYKMCLVKAKSVEESDAVKNQLVNLGYDAFSQSDVTKVLNVFFLILEGFLACIGSIGLLVSLFGIANTMATAVIERTREIGILKAVGARNGDVRFIFLLEAAVIGLIGGVTGLGAGWFVGVTLNSIAHVAFGIDEANLFQIPILLAVGSLVFSTVVSMVAGLLPAIRAARLDPVKALRYE